MANFRKQRLGYFVVYNNQASLKTRCRIFNKPNYNNVLDGVTEQTTGYENELARNVVTENGARWIDAALPWIMPAHRPDGSARTDAGDFIGDSLDHCVKLRDTARNTAQAGEPCRENTALKKFTRNYAA